MEPTIPDTNPYYPPVEAEELLRLEAFARAHGVILEPAVHCLTAEIRRLQRELEASERRFAQLQAAAQLTKARRRRGRPRN